MLATVLWTLPVPSTSFLGGGPVLDIRPKREVAVRFSYEGEEDETVEVTVAFQQVEAFKCVYYRARDESARDAYDRIIDRGRSPWLDEICANLRKNGDSPDGLRHLVINFDDGPAYEFLCRGFTVVQ